MKKKCTQYVCENCTSWKAKLLKVKQAYEEKLKAAYAAVKQLHTSLEKCKKHAQEVEQLYKERFETELQVCEVESEHYTPEDLHPQRMRSYYDELLRTYPNLKALLRPLFSKYFIDKEKTRATNSRWMACAGLYRAHVADTILRSKNSKAVLRTHMATGVYCYQNRCPESIWLYLQRLKLVPSRQRVDKYLKSLPPPVFSPEKFRFAHYDNCDIYLHVTHKRTTHASEYLHLVSRLVFEVSRQIAVTPETMFKPYNGEEMKNFMRFLLMDFRDQCKIVKTASYIITKAKDFGLLKLTLKDNVFTIDNVELTVLSVEVDRQTISYEDNRAIVRKLWEEIGIPYDQAIGIFGGDWQTFTRMWDMRIKDPILFRFLLPFPGEWHWNWHILKGIFKI